MCRQSLYMWVKVHPEFAEAMDEAQFAALAWWRMSARPASAWASKFNAALCFPWLKNRFRHDGYGDKYELEHSGTVETEERQLTDLDLARRVAFVPQRGHGAAEREETQCRLTGLGRALETDTPYHGRLLRHVLGRRCLAEQDAFEIVAPSTSRDPQ